MSLLCASDLAFQYSNQSELLFQKASFEVNPGDRIGLVGPNGAGKTSLLRILAGELEPHAGSLVRRQKLQVSYVRKLTGPSADETLKEFVLASNEALKKLHGEIRARESRRALSLRPGTLH